MERYAINSYFSSVHIPEPSESVNVDAKRSTKGSLESKTLNETEEDSRKHSTLNEPLINCQSQLTASPPSQKLYNSMHQASTINPSERISFSEHCSHIVSNVDGTSSLFSKIYELDHTVYADYTASGRGLIFIEHYMLTYVWPFYANTHSENNAFALQTTRFRESARSIIKKCLNVTDDDVVIFTGSGSTAAINKFVDILQLRTDEIRNRTVVFVSTSEHHSNILPWKETGVQFVRIPNNEKGLLDQNVLKENLIYYRDLTKKSIICIFNAGSNVTGVLADVDRISELVHEHGGYIFWDYAAAAPYVHIDMNPSEKAAKDAVFISTHKFIGGPGTPGLLIAKKKLFENPVPTGCGGGTVNFVTRTATEYAKDIETREEGGTPSILGSIRTGLVFHLKQSIGHELIEGRETELVHKFFQRFQNHPTLFILGPPDLAGNFLFIAIAWTLFVLNIVKYATSYFQRTSYKVIEKPNGFYIFKEIYENETQWESNCTSNYSKSEADNIFRWFIASKKSENIVFHVFYWFMMVIALTISLAPSISYVFKYFKSNHYNITERYCLSSMLHFIRTFFSITVFVLPSFYMNTFNFTSEPCLTAYPTTFSIDISPFIFATFIGLIIYFIF
ncbi:unnamed protein product, partial [Rotaria socialis]